MQVQLKTLQELSKARDGAFQAALQALGRAKQRHRTARPHRAISRLSLGPYLLLQVILLPILFCAALLVMQPQLLAFWRELMLFWASLLNLPLAASANPDSLHQLGLLWLPATGMSDLPSERTWFITAAATLLAAAGSFALTGPMLPLKYLLRIGCAVQAMALVFFWWLPAWFPYTVANHLQDMVSLGYVLLIASPVMLALGYYVLRIGLWTKLWHTFLILLFFIIMVPHQALAHALLLQHGSLLFMPLLYICFGALFDVLVFVALYSWAASTAPANATT
ncbi:MAG: hypothetical protein ACKVIH_12310 [Burkholderiales bacterium]